MCIWIENNINRPVVYASGVYRNYKFLVFVVCGILSRRYGIAKKDFRCGPCFYDGLRRRRCKGIRENILRE